MSAEDPEQAEVNQAAASKANREAMMHEVREHKAEYTSLPIVIVCAIPLLMFGSLLLSMLGLQSKWWYLALIGIPVLIGFFYPLILIDRLRTPLRLGNGELVNGWKRRKVLIGFAVAAMLWMLRFEIFAWLEKIWNGWQGNW